MVAVSGDRISFRHGTFLHVALLECHTILKKFIECVQNESL